MERWMVFALATMIIFSLSSVPVHATSVHVVQPTKIELTLSHQLLRGELMKVSGRLSSIPDGRPIALAKIHLQYYRSGETDITREVIIISSNPSGLFEDIFNTTSLLRIGTWIVNASFPTQFGYESTSTLETFTIVVQPALSLYLSNHDIAFGQSVTVSGLLFACIPCIQDEVVVSFTRPDNSSISKSLRLTATGGPYPGGYYNGTFAPDVPGAWHIRAVWKGNEVSLPAYSQSDELIVEAPRTRVDMRMFLYAPMAIAAVSVLTLMVTLRRRRLRKNPAGSCQQPSSLPTLGSKFADLR